MRHPLWHLVTALVWLAALAAILAPVAVLTWYAGAGRWW